MCSNVIQQNMLNAKKPTAMSKTADNNPFITSMPGYYFAFLSPDYYYCIYVCFEHSIPCMDFLPLYLGTGTAGSV